jgi:hypothetical protein
MFEGVGPPLVQPGDGRVIGQEIGTIRGNALMASSPAFGPSSALALAQNSCMVGR